MSEPLDRIKDADLRAAIESGSTGEVRYPDSAIRFDSDRRILIDLQLSPRVDESGEVVWLLHEIRPLSS